jgi:hypothetical protein
MSLELAAEFGLELLDRGRMGDDDLHQSLQR